MWLANALTLSRIPLAVAFWLTYGNRWWSIAIVLAAAASDALDGTVARRARARDPGASTAGEWLDPLADKVFVLAVVVAIMMYEPTPWYVVAAACARDVIVVPLAVVFRVVRPHAAHAFQASALGKATTIAQLATLIALIGHVPGAAILAYATGVLGIVTVVQYVRTRS